MEGIKHQLLLDACQGKPVQALKASRARRAAALLAPRSRSLLLSSRRALSPGERGAARAAAR